MPKLFFGLEIPETIKPDLLRVQKPVDGARWQNEQQLHLTLAFLGQVDEHRVALACDLARKVTAPPCELDVRGVGCFGSPDHPKILWAGVTPEQALSELQQSLAAQLISGGFKLKNQPFKPHITLSRFRARAGSVAAMLKAHENTAFGTLPVNDFVLFESTPRPEGSVYTVLERFVLAH
ncbi:RNA 2',3'-cyclic phosphodiesterase [Marinobacter halophilus]|uniref:RNA 2',3'-cyclic phosphodiesterase n=1 Tax=Marinobacter halophilus TaxID=1323740 RepID=A0A2T1KD24_9GAMM|nr:RNA 2',3'-cyclic phosphodiesterase [Marinobacter halophilus]PSF08026.1 RNA 2',3'-cyclic phosphodiesterase [Marinobacter halophilus]GGC59102.1 RNA 2',3'-cyclic phosphodiesterase [Marinobacter halophilus]